MSDYSSTTEPQSAPSLHSEENVSTRTYATVSFIIAAISTLVEVLFFSESLGQLAWLYVLALFGSGTAIITGHIALAEIKRGADSSRRGLALVATILGYLGIASFVALILFLLGIVVLLSNASF